MLSHDTLVEKLYNTSGNVNETAGQPIVFSLNEADDAIWILTSTFIIFTMQSGFGLLESGTVAPKNEVNIMVKNAVDVILGGLSYWIFGYAFSFGTDKGMSNGFTGWGRFVVTAHGDEIGAVYSKFFFQASFATTATTIVSGAMAERTKLEAYIFFSFINTLVFCWPAHWVWSENGWLHQMGIIDVAGAGPVHLVGGATGLIATLLLKPRHGRYERDHPPPMGSPSNCILGMFMLWWGWLGFNCGSTFGISGWKWKLAARSAVATLCSSIGGGTVGLTLSYIVKKRKFDLTYLINGLLSSLVGITGMCALAQPWEGFVIGSTTALMALSAIELLDKLKIDDPVGCVGVHAVGGMCSLIFVGLLVDNDRLRVALGITHHSYGLLRGGGWYQLGIQVLGIVSLFTWTAISSFIVLKIIDLTLGLRLSLQHELLGADLVEHCIGCIDYDKRTNTIIAIPAVSEHDVIQSCPEFNQTHKDKHRHILHDCLRNSVQALLLANKRLSPAEASTSSHQLNCGVASTSGNNTKRSSPETSQQNGEGIPGRPQYHSRGQTKRFTKLLKLFRRNRQFEMRDHGSESCPNIYNVSDAGITSKADMRLKNQLKSVNCAYINEAFNNGETLRCEVRSSAF